MDEITEKGRLTFSAWPPEDKQRKNEKQGPYEIKMVSFQEVGKFMGSSPSVWAIVYT